MLPQHLTALGLLLCGLGTALEESYTEYATRLKRQLLTRDPAYDAAVAPRSKREVGYSKAGTDVRMSIRFFKVEGVEAYTGQMRLKVWVRMTWKDLRLSWDPAAHGNVTQLTMRAAHSANMDNTEIWVPDIQLYNANEGTQSHMDEASASVYDDGTVFWSRPGILDTLCKFSGLVAFPFDHLKCAMEWGGWSLSDGFQGINLTDAGFVFLTNEETAGTSYQEYSIRNVAVTVAQTFYDSYPSEPWTIVKYNVELNRATFYYGTLILFPTILITYLSFGVFFMSHEVGERLSFGITLLLVVEVMRASVATFVPICGELLWIDLFMLVNSFYCCMSLLETMTVLFFAFHTDEHLLPTWLAWLAPWLFCGNDSERRAMRVVESQAGLIYRRFSKGMFNDRHDLEKLQEEHIITETDTAKLIFFEHLFYMLDSDSNGLIAIKDAAIMLSFVCLGTGRDELEQTLADHFSTHHRLNCADFVETCCELLWGMPFEAIRMGAENYNSSYMRFTKLCSNYWLSWSKTVDRWSRFWLPMSFTISLFLLFNLNMEDDYDGKSPEMFQGFGPAYMTIAGVFRSLIMPALAVICIIAWCYMRKRATAMKREPPEVEQGEVAVKQKRISVWRLSSSEDSFFGV